MAIKCKNKACRAEANFSIHGSCRSCGRKCSEPYNKNPEEPKSKRNGRVRRKKVATAGRKN